MAEMDKAICVINTDVVRKIARRCGALFELENSLEEQFKGVKLRGFTDGSVIKDGQKLFNYKNVFAGVSADRSHDLRKEWVSLEAARKSGRAEEISAKKQKKAKKSVGKKNSKKVKKKRESKKVRRKRGSKAVGRPRKSRRVIDKQNSKNVVGRQNPEKGVLGAASRSISAKRLRVDPEEQRVPVVQAPKRKLVGGQLLFHNRRVRTLSLMDGFDQIQ